MFVTCTLSSWLIIGWIGPALGLSQLYGGVEHDGYLEIARTLGSEGRFALNPGGAPILHRPPVYPLFLLAVHALGGEDRYALCAAQAALAGLMSVIAFRYTRRNLGPRTAQWTVLGILAYPWLYWHVKNPMTPVLLALLYWMFLACWAAAQSSNRSSRWLLTGLVGGLMSLTHGGTLLLLPAVAVGSALWQAARGRYRAASLPLLGLVPFIAAIAPWVARNYEVADRLFVTSNAGFTYFWGLAVSETTFGRHTPNARQRAFVLAGIAGQEAELVKASGVLDSDIDALFTRRMVEHMLDHPGQLATKALTGAVWYWFPLEVGVESVALWLLNGLALALGSVGVLVARRKGRSVGPVLVCILYSWGIHSVIMATVGHAQYSFSSLMLLMPYVVLGAGALQCHPCMIARLDQ